MILEYIIGISSSEADGIISYRVSGTRQQVKKHLVTLVKSDKSNDKEAWDYGTTTMKDLDEEQEIISGYGVYDDYHIDYTATPDKEPIIL